jgi:hypothetical protein
MSFFLVWWSTVARGVGRATVAKWKKIYTDNEASASGFWGFIAKFLLNIQYSVADENALNWPKSNRRINFSYFSKFKD